MTQQMLLTLIGKDKPGLLDTVAQQVFAAGGNWQKSNFAHLAGHFAGFAEIQLPHEQQQALLDQLARHDELQIELVAGEASDTPTRQAEVSILGNDKPGIVQELSSVLRQFDLNIISFESQLQSAPNWGSALFKGQAKVAIPQEFSLDELRDALQALADDLIVEIELA